LGASVFTAVALAGCPGLPWLDIAEPDCGDHLDYDYGPLPWLNPEALHPREGDNESLIFSWSVDGEKGCIDQHASYRAGLFVIGRPDCSEEAPVVEVRTQAGLTGRTVPVLGKGSEGSYEFLQDGEIGLRQFNQPQYVFLTLEATFPGGEGAFDPETGRENQDSAPIRCVHERVKSVELHLDYLAPPGAEAAPAS
jgi:hypothetical protein